MAVARRASGDPKVIGPGTNAYDLLLKGLGKLDSGVCHLFGPDRTGIHRSAGLFGSDTLNRALELKPDILHLHWINGACLSLRQLSSIKTPVVWTLHDTWPFGGFGHYESSSMADWYQSGNKQSPAPPGGRLSIWMKRQAQPRAPMMIVTPSNWMADCARASRVFEGREVRVIPNCVELDLWRPEPPDACRAKLGIDPSSRIILFSASEGFTEERKGGALFIETVQHLQANGHSDLAVILIGVATVPDALKDRCEVRALGYVSAVDDLRRLYSAADFVIIPSRLDNLPNVALEAQACGTPVGCFEVAGMRDIVEDDINGVIAPPFDCCILAEKIANILSSRQRADAMREASRTYAQNRYAGQEVAKMYEQAYAQCLQGAK